MQFPHCSVLILSYLICIIRKLFSILQPVEFNCVGTRTFWKKQIKTQTHTHTYSICDTSQFIIFRISSQLHIRIIVCLSYNFILFSIDSHTEAQCLFCFLFLVFVDSSIFVNFLFSSIIVHESALVKHFVDLLLSAHEEKRQ